MKEVIKLDADMYVPVNVNEIARKVSGVSRAASFAARTFLRGGRIILRFFTWLFLADFALQFVHSRRTGHSLPEMVEWLAGPMQEWVENVSQIDFRYKFRMGIVDFMPLALMIGFLVLRLRVDSLREWLEPKKSPERGRPRGQREAVNRRADEF